MFDTFFWVSSQLSESGPIYICYFCTINPYIFDLGTTSDIFLGELSLSTDFTIKFCQNSDWISPLATSPKCMGITWAYLGAIIIQRMQYKLQKSATMVGKGNLCAIGETLIPNKHW